MGESKDHLFPNSTWCFSLVLEKSIYAIQIACPFGIHAVSFGFCLNIFKSYVLIALNLIYNFSNFLFTQLFIKCYYIIFSATGIFNTCLWHAIYASAGWYSTRSILCNIVIILACICRRTFNGKNTKFLLFKIITTIILALTCTFLILCMHLGFHQIQVRVF